MGCREPATVMSGELEAIEITAAGLEPGRECTLIAAQPHPNRVLLSHFEVTELSPQSSLAQLTDLRIERLSYLITPVPLRLLENEQRNARERAELQARRQLQALQQSEPRLGLLNPQLLRQLTKLDRRAMRLIALDIRWKPQQQLILTLKNAGTTVIDKVSLELVLYSLDGSLPITN